MIITYTLGNPEVYEPAIDERAAQGKKLLKAGRTSDYEGGCVFRTKEDAIKFAEENNYPYIPYKLLLKNGWKDVDESTLKTEGYMELLADSEIERI